MRPLGFLTYIQWPFRVLAGGALIGLVVITAVDVIGRVGFNSPLGFAYELIGVLLGVTVYAGLVVMNCTRDHIRIDLFAPFLSRFQTFDRIRDLVVWGLELTFFALLAGYIGRQAAQMMRWNETFLFLPMERWIPLAFYSGLTAVSVLTTLFAIIPALRGPVKDKS